MKYEVKVVESVIGEDDQVVRIDKHIKKINIETEVNLTFAILVCMTCESHQNNIRKKLIVPNVETHEEAYQKAEIQHKLNGEWATQVGITLFQTNTNFEVPYEWKDCETQFHNGKRMDK